LAFGISELGLLPKDFWHLTFFEYNLLCEGYFTRQVREWERTRFLAWAALLPSSKDGRLELTDIMKLPSDPEPPEYGPDYFKTADELNDLLQKWTKQN